MLYHVCRRTIVEPRTRMHIVKKVLAFFQVIANKEQCHSPWVKLMNYTLKPNHSKEPGRETGQPSQRQNRNSDEGAEAGGIMEYPFVAAIVRLRNGGGRHL